MSIPDNERFKEIARQLIREYFEKPNKLVRITGNASFLKVDGTGQICYEFKLEDLNNAN